MCDSCLIGGKFCEKTARQAADNAVGFRDIDDDVITPLDVGDAFYCQVVEERA